jgi:hypothetical protein
VLCKPPILLASILQDYVRRCEKAEHEPDMDAERRVKDQGTGHTVVRRFIERTNDPLRQVFTERFRIDEFDEHGRVLDSAETSWTFRWNTRQEMRYLFELTGFEVVTEYSDFFRSPPAYGAEQLWVVRKIGEVTRRFSA